MRKVVFYYHTRNLSTIRKIQEHFGFPKKMTVNGEWVVNVKNEQWEELKEIERRGYIRITVEQFKIACGVIAMAERSGDDEFVPKIWEDM